jgi:hypothetical protein
MFPPAGSAASVLNTRWLLDTWMRPLAFYKIAQHCCSACITLNEQLSAWAISENRAIIENWALKQRDRYAKRFEQLRTQVKQYQAALSQSK